MRVHNCEIFMRDGAPFHQSKVVKKFLEQKRIQMLEWQRNSPDLNPIGNLCNLMKNKVSIKHLSSLDALQTAIKEVWVREISADYCCKLIDSMPRRLQEVINARAVTQIVIVNVFLSFLCKLVMFFITLIN